MAYLSSLLLFIAILFPTTLFSIIDLPIFATKQSSNMIRYISTDGKYTYYTRRTGALALATNFKVVEILQSKPLTDYFITSSRAKKNLLISKTHTLFEENNTQLQSEIYVEPYGQGKIRLLGLGVDPKLHRGDLFASYFNNQNFTLIFRELATKEEIQISLTNRLSSHFSISRVLLPNNDILYTDINSDGAHGILYFASEKKEISLFKKGVDFQTTFDLCQSQDGIIVVTKGHDKLKRTQIDLYQPTKSSLKFIKNLYSSKSDDGLSLLCDEKESQIYFLRHLQNSEKLEAVVLDTQSGNIKSLTSADGLANLMRMDGRLLTLIAGEYYIIEGDNALQAKGALLE